MATEPKGGLPAPIRSIGSAVKRWMSGRGAVQVAPERTVRPPTVHGRDELEDWSWLGDPVTLNALAGTANRQINSRMQVYEKWQDMVADPVISSALNLHCTAALGGDENTGEMVFIETTPEAKKDPKAVELVTELAADLQPLFNRIVTTVCFNGVTFGDAYGRIYAEERVGVRDVYVDELVLPPLVQPYERGNTTIGFTVATGERYQERLTVMQMARMKMPRRLYKPQNRVVEKAIRSTLRIDRLEDLPALPALAGGSFLDGAEAAYDKFAASWAGLTGQRVRDSIDESMIGVQQAGMTPAQRKVFKESLERMFERSNAYINEVVSRGRAVFGRIMHFIPFSSDKQLTEIRGPVQSGAANNMTIDDVMFNAKLLAGALGTDLSMIGFGDIMSGGLGEGGFFRVSAQSAERARAIRSAAADFFNHIVEVHVLTKHGIDMTGRKVPWKISFYSGISALETEHAKTKADNINSAALIVQTLAQIKELGLDKEAAQQFMEREMGMDAADAKQYAAALEKAAKADKEAEAAANGGGFGGAPGGIIPGADPGEPGGGVDTAEG